MNHLRHLTKYPVRAAAFCRARKRLPLATLQYLLAKTAAACPKNPPPSRNGLRAFLVDGSSTICPDTPALQKAFEQPQPQKPSCGFPVPKLLGLFDAFTVMIQQLLVDPLYTHDLTGAWRLHASLKPGDLSENSEYKFALEERDLLRARLAQMNEEHKMAKVLSSADVPTDTAGIGSAITVRDLKTGEVKRFVILGPWEADANKGIINYKTPLAQAMMGAGVGDKRTMNFRGHIEEFVIEKLEHGLIGSQE